MDLGIYSFYAYVLISSRLILVTSRSRWQLKLHFCNIALLLTSTCVGARRDHGLIIRGMIN